MITQERAGNEVLQERRLSGHDVPDIYRGRARRSVVSWLWEDRRSNVSDKKLKVLILSLQERLGREPTEEEVLGFINGTQEEREAIWNKEVKS